MARGHPRRQKATPAASGGMMNGQSQPQPLKPNPVRKPPAAFAAGSSATANMPSTVPSAAPMAPRRVKRRSKARAMKLSRAPTSRSVRITCPFAASEACAASVIIPAIAPPIRSSDSTPRKRSRPAAATSGRRQRVWSSSTAPGASAASRIRSPSASIPAEVSVSSTSVGSGRLSTGRSGPNQGSSRVFISASSRAW